MSTVPIQNEFRRKTRLMGSAFEFVITDDKGNGEKFIDQSVAEVKRIEDLLTEFSESSQTSAINKNAWHGPVEVDAEVYNLLKRCKELSKFTQGAFDITAGVFKKLYNFKGEKFELPSREKLRNTLQKVGSDKITLLEGNRIQLNHPGMHIGFGAIGKGYAADRVKNMLLELKVSGGVINASGDLTVWGKRADGSPWKVGIADPDDPLKTIGWIEIENASMATSGNYEQYFEHNGIRYSHNIDPKSGDPVTGIKSVTIISPSAELSDALATAVTIMGKDVGLHFIEQIPSTHCLIIDDHNKVTTTRNLTLAKSLEYETA
jgi:FAD:protein FMN transferase